MRTRRFPALLLALLCASRLAAVEVTGEAPKFLGDKFRADWHQRPLKEVLKDLERFIEKPLVRSASVTKLGDSQLVTLVDDKKVTLREELELLESSQDLHFTTEPLRLRVETWDDFRDRKRRPVDLTLRDYGLFSAVRDFPGRQLGFGVASAGGGGGGFSLYKADDDHAAGRAPDPTAVVDWLQQISTSGGLELRGHGNVYVLVTDEEEAAMRAALTELHKRTMRRSDWRVTFGTLPAAESFPNGIIPAADADKLAARLQGRDQLVLEAMSGQRVNTTALRQQAHLGTVDVVNAALDAKVEVFDSGRSADLRPSLGMNFTLLSYQLGWVDPQDPTTSELRNPGRIAPGSTTSTSTEAVKDDAKDPKEKNRTVTVTTVAAATRNGERVQITKAAAWAWQPRGECYLASGMALVIASEHPAGHALMIVQETP